MQPQQTLPSSSLKTEIASERKPKKQQQQPRQLLSCTKCRERKVKVSHVNAALVHVSILSLDTNSVIAPSHALLVVPEVYQRNVTSSWEKGQNSGRFSSHSSSEGYELKINDSKNASWPTRRRTLKTVKLKRALQEPEQSRMDGVQVINDASAQTIRLTAFTLDLQDWLVS
jgi:hypothetical protein